MGVPASLVPLVPPYAGSAIRAARCDEAHGSKQCNRRKTLGHDVLQIVTVVVL
jgi:hypothetical protein